MAAGGGGGGGAGPWEVYSCNTQGGGNVGFVTGEIRSSDVVMLQESGTPGWATNLTPVPGMPNVMQGQVNFGTRTRQAMFNVVHYPNGRCSLTVMVSLDVAPAVVPGLVYGPGGPGGGLRPIVTATAGGTIYGSLHGPSGHHAAATGVANHQLNQLDALGQPYIVAGDFNSSAAAQSRAGGRNGYEPDGATHQGGNTLDGAVTSVGINGEVSAASNRGSDHFGVHGRFN